MFFKKNCIPSLKEKKYIYHDTFRFERSKMPFAGKCFPGSKEQKIPVVGKHVRLERANIPFTVNISRAQKSHKYLSR